MASVTASINIGSVTYANDEAITVSGPDKDIVTLTVDGEVSADVAKIETYKPRSMQATAYGKLLFKNASTTYPLIVSLAGITGVGNTLASNGASTMLKVEGAWIQIATSDGSRNQTIDINSVVSLNGAKIDNPPIIFAERTAGSDDYVPMFNILGARKNALNATYANYSVLGAHAQNVELGNVFEYDEYTHTIYLGMSDRWTVYATVTSGTLIVAGAEYDHNGSRFTVENVHSWAISTTRYYVLRLIRTSGTGDPQSSGSYTKFSGTGETTLTIGAAAVATGGWVPPNGAKIRIPNIHFTAEGTPTTTSTRAFLTLDNWNPGRYDFSICSFSNRWGKNNGQNNFTSLKMRHFCCAYPFYHNGQIVEAMDIDGFFGTIDMQHRAGIQVRSILGETTFKNVFVCGSAIFGSQIQLTAPTNPVEIGEISFLATVLRMVGAENMYSIQLSSIAAQDETPLSIGPITSIGQRVSITDVENLYVNGFKFSSTPDGCSRSLSGMYSMLGIGGRNQGDATYGKNLTLRGVRLVTGGDAPFNHTTTNSMLFASSIKTVNLAIHDVVIDGQNKWTGAAGAQGLFYASAGFGDRTWIANIDFPNTNGYVVPLGISAARKMRASAIRASGHSTTAPITSCILDCVSARAYVANSSSANAFAHVVYGTTYTDGGLYLAFGSEDQGAGYLTANTGVKGTDFLFDYAQVVMPGTCNLTYRNTSPLKGVVSATGAGAAGINSAGYQTSSFSANITVTFRLSNAGAEDWTASRSLTGANFTTSFNELTGYDSNVGFDIECVVDAASTGLGSARYIAYHAITGLTIDWAYAPSEVGFIEVGITDTETGASVAVANNTTPSAPVLEGFEIAGVSGSVTFEYPYNFDNNPTAVKLVARKAGFNEYVFEGQSYQAGKFVPAVLSQAAAITSGTPASITGVTPNGAAKTLTLTAQLVDAYDHGQWWSCQEANMLYSIPLTSSNGSVFTQPSDWTVISTTLDGSKTLAGGTLQIGTAGTYTPALSDLTIKMTATGAYDLTDATLSGVITLTNTSGAAIDVAMPSLVGYSIVNTGVGVAAVNVTYPTVARGLDFDGVLTGSTVKVFATGTQTVIATPTGPNWIWSESGGTDLTVDYTIQKAGYDPIRVTGVTVNSAVLPVAVQQQVARAYVASSGLTFDTNCFANPTTKLFGLTAASTLQNFYSRMIESWITEATLQNKPFPITPNGPNSFTLGDGWDWNLTTYPNSITLLSRDGMRLVDSGGTVTAMWAAVLSVGVPASMQVRYQQQDGIGTTNALTTGNIDQLIQIYKTGTGAYDYTSWLVLKVQAEGYDQAEAVVLDIYPTLDDQLFVVALVPAPNGVAAGAADATVTITSEPTPVTWNGQAFSTTIKDTDNSHSGLEIMQAIRALNDFNMHDMIRPHGTKFQTVTGNVYGDTLTTPAGVRVVKADGTTPHPDFDLFVADNASTYVPPVVAPIEWAGALDGTTVLLYNDVGGGAGVIIDTQVISGAGGYNLDVSLPSVDVAVGDPLRIRFGHKQYYAGEIQGTMTSTGWTAVGTMVLHPVYAAWGLDGAVYDQGHTPPGPYVMDGTHLQVDIAAGATTGLKTQLGAWTQYLMTLPAGLAAFYGAWDLLAVNQIRQNVGVIDVMIDVPTAGALFSFTDNDVNYYRSDFTFPGNVEAGHGLIAMTYNASIFVPDPIIISGSSVITGSINDVTGKVQDGLTAQGFTITRALKLDNLDVAVSTRMAGADFVIPPTPEANATAIFAQAGITPMPSDMKKTNGEQIVGNGSAADKFRSHLVP